MSSIPTEVVDNNEYFIAVCMPDPDYEKLIPHSFMYVGVRYPDGVVAPLHIIGKVFAGGSSHCIRGVIAEKAEIMDEYRYHKNSNRFCLSYKAYSITRSQLSALRHFLLNNIGAEFKQNI